MNRTDTNLDGRLEYAHAGVLRQPLVVGHVEEDAGLADRRISPARERALFPPLRVAVLGQR